MTTSATASTTEYEVWYDAHDGARRHFKAATKADVKEHIAWLRDQDDKKQLLAAAIGLQTDPHEYNVEILQVTTTTKKVTL